MISDYIRFVVYEPAKNQTKGVGQPVKLRPVASIPVKGG